MGKGCRTNCVIWRAWPFSNIMLSNRFILKRDEKYLDFGIGNWILDNL